MVQALEPFEVGALGLWTTSPHWRAVVGTRSISLAGRMESGGSFPGHGSLGRGEKVWVGIFSVMP